MTPELHQNSRLAVLRINRDGRVISTNETARQLFGDYCIGKECDAVVQGKGADGESMCRNGCARELAASLMEEKGIVPARLKAKSHPVRIECTRVGEEVNVLIEPPGPEDSTQRLTLQERRVLSLVAKGLSTVEISRQLGIQTSTVRTHVEHARGRLGASTRAEAVWRALRTGQLDE